jgi:hypothetical protein
MIRRGCAPSRPLPAIALCLAAAGAAAGPAPVGSCAAAPAELHAVDVVDLFLKHKGAYTLSRRSGCLILDQSGAEFNAVLLSLPNFDSPYAMRVAAKIGKSMLLPRIDMLDGQYQVLRSFGGDALKRRGTEMSLEVFFEPANAQERYALIYPDPPHVHDTDHRTTSDPQMISVGTGFLVMGAERAADIAATDSGDLVLSLIGDRWNKTPR